MLYFAEINVKMKIPESFLHFKEITDHARLQIIRDYAFIVRIAVTLQFRDQFSLSTSYFLIISMHIISIFTVYKYQCLQSTY